MKVVLDENFWDEKRQVHPNLDETVPNLWLKLHESPLEHCPFAFH